MPPPELERAEPVDQEAHLDAAPRTVDERVHEPAADLVGLEDVDLERHVVGRRADRLQHRREKGVAVLKQGDLAAPVHRVVEQSRSGVDECIRSGCGVGAEPVVGLAPVGQEERADDAEERHQAGGEQRPPPPRKPGVQQLAHERALSGG